MSEPLPLPPEVLSMLAAVRSWSGDDRPHPVTAEERAGWLAGLRQLSDAVQAAFTAVLADFDAYGDGQTLTGAQSSAGWLRARLGLAPGDAGQQMRVARG